MSSCASRRAASAAPICTTTTTAASAPCGSKEPMILGHEIAGTVARVGAEVASVKPGQRVAVNPSQPCGQCRYCQEGKQNHFLDMRFYGSAMRFPHVQGGFRDVLVCDEAQGVAVPPAISATQAAFAEPFAVCLHAANRAGPLLG